MEAEATRNGRDKKKAGDDVLCLKTKGDQFLEDEKYEKALKCYNEAIEQNKSNLELLLRKAYLYYVTKKYNDCLDQAQMIVAASDKETTICESATVFKALKLIGLSLNRIYDSQPPSQDRSKITKAFMQAINCLPTTEIEPLITEYNRWVKNGSNGSFKTVFEAGVMLYSYGNLMEAIEMFTKAISYDEISSIAYACRAVCYANSGCEKELRRDVSECINLDYRSHNYFLNKADEFNLLGQIEASFQLYKALSLAAETYKLSVGNFFPNMLLDKQLSKSEKRRFKDLDESWHKNCFLPLQELYRNCEPELDSHSDSDNIEAPEKSGEETNNSDHASGLRAKGDKLFATEKFEEALECYDKAIEQDKLNLLLCNVNIYFNQKKYKECIDEADKLVAISFSEEQYKSPAVFKALRLLTASHVSLNQFGLAKEACMKAMQFSEPTAEIELLIKDYNKWSKQSTSKNLIIDRSASNADLDAGIILYARGDSLGAKSKFKSAISLDKSNALAYACRAVRDAREYRKVLVDVKECINLDHRILGYFINKADEWRLNGQMGAASKLYEALSSVGDTYKSSVGKFFPKLLRNERLNRSEKKRFKELEESWRKIYLPTLAKLDQNFDSDLEQN